MRAITTQDLIHVCGGTNIEVSEVPALAMYAGIATFGTSLLLISGNTLASSAMAGFVFVPGVALGGASIGVGAYLYGPELWNYISSKF